MKRRKNQTESSFRKLVWSEMSEYVRQKNADYRGYVSCYTCGVKKNWKEMDCGHFRHIDALDFTLDAIRPQCTRCNRNLSGNLGVFAVKLIKEIGLERVEALQKVNVKRFGMPELRKIREWIKTLYDIPI